MQELEDFGTSRGALHSGKIRDIASEKLGDLFQAEQRDINQMREKLAYTGLQRELQRQEQGITAANTWAGYDSNQKAQAMEFLTRGYEADIDKWFKQGSIDMDKFKTMVSQRLGISELELTKSGQDMQLLATLMDYKLESAKTDAERAYIDAQIKKIGWSMTEGERNAWAAVWQAGLGIAEKMFTGY